MLISQFLGNKKRLIFGSKIQELKCMGLNICLSNQISKMSEKITLPCLACQLWLLELPN